MVLEVIPTVQSKTEGIDQLLQHFAGAVHLLQ